MPQVACTKYTVSRDSMVSKLTSQLITRRKKLPTDRGKLTDKESGFESSPNSPRAESALEHGQLAPGSHGKSPARAYFCTWLSCVCMLLVLIAGN